MVLHLCGPRRWRTFHSSFEEDFTASARHHTVMAPGCFVSTDQTHFGRGGRLPQRRAETRHKPKCLNQRRVVRRRQQPPGRTVSVPAVVHIVKHSWLLRGTNTAAGTVWALVKMSAKTAQQRSCRRLIYSQQRRQWQNQGADHNKDTKQVVKLKKGRVK